MSERVRHAARGLLLTPCNRILMMRFVTEDRAVWITPGGGLDSGETAQEALQRELREETARSHYAVGPEIWRRTTTFRLDARTVTQRERYFLVPTPYFTPPSVMPDERERRWFGGFRWWTVEDIRASDELFAPRQIALRLSDLIDVGPPPEPIDVGR